MCSRLCPLVWGADGAGDRKAQLPTSSVAESVTFNSTVILDDQNHWNAKNWETIDLSQNNYQLSRQFNLTEWSRRNARGDTMVELPPEWNPCYFWWERCWWGFSVRIDGIRWNTGQSRWISHAWRSGFTERAIEQFCHTRPKNIPI